MAMKDILYCRQIRSSKSRACLGYRLIRDVNRMSKSIRWHPRGFLPDICNRMMARLIISRQVTVRRTELWQRTRSRRKSRPADCSRQRERWTEIDMWHSARWGCMTFCRVKWRRLKSGRPPYYPAGHNIESPSKPLVLDISCQTISLFFFSIPILSHITHHVSRTHSQAQHRRLDPVSFSEATREVLSRS